MKIEIASVVTSIPNFASSAESGLLQIGRDPAFLALPTVTFVTVEDRELVTLVAVVLVIRSITLQYACLVSQAVLPVTTLSHLTVKAAS